MFGLFKRKPKRELPDLSPDMLRARDETVQWCLSQVGEFIGRKVSVCPAFGEMHDARIGAYACGFLSGHIQVTKADWTWAKGDQELMDLGHFAICAGVLVALLGADRAMQVHPHMPALGKATDDLLLADRVGGTDGIAHAQGRAKQNGGLLLHYLKNNVEV